MALARVLCFFTWWMFTLPSSQPAMHQTLINEKHYIKIKIRQFTKEGRDDWLTSSIFNPPKRLCRNEFMEVCKLSFYVWCKCEHVMCRTGWRLAKYTATQERFVFWMSRWKNSNRKRVQTHGAQLGLLWAGSSRQLALKTLLQMHSNPLLNTSFWYIYDFHPARSIHKPFLSVHLLQRLESSQSDGEYESRKKNGI